MRKYKPRGAPYLKREVNKSSKLKKNWWHKYMKLERESPVPIGVFLQISQIKPHHEWDFGITPDPLQCSHFGCGRELSLRERLFSDYCINHQDPDEKTIVAVNKYL